MKRAQSCVPRGRSCSTYSAPTMANRYDFGLRLIVDTITVPPGFASAAQAATVEPGSGTCSTNSMHVTTSNAPGISPASASAATSR